MSSVVSRNPGGLTSVSGPAVSGSASSVQISTQSGSAIPISELGNVLAQFKNILCISPQASQPKSSNLGALSALSLSDITQFSRESRFTVGNWLDQMEFRF